MNTNELIKRWKAEERIAYIHGWDFSHIAGRYAEEDDLPWDYRETILRHLKPEMKVLDIDTGGGEFLLSLNHPHGNTAATENYQPNVELCREVLLPLGIDFRPADGGGKLPFDDGSFDMVINRHGDFNAEEIWRVLKPGGLFITQQVGAENDRELVELLCGETELPFPEQYLDVTTRKFRDTGFGILETQGVLSSHPVLRCGRAGLACSRHRMGIPRILGGYPPGSAAERPADPGAKQ